jgi:hypothetical protein
MIKKLNLTKKILFSEYLKTEKIILSTEIIALLMKHKFLLKDDYDDGNNYRAFVDKATGYLKFNNPGMVINRNTLTKGIIRENFHGNTLKFNNIYLIEEAKTKKELINDIIAIEVNIKETEQKKTELENKLEYLIEFDLDSVSEEDYNDFKKQKITNNLLEKRSAIAEIKV